MRSQQNRRTRLKRKRKNARRPVAQPTPLAAIGLIGALAQPSKVAWDQALAETKA